MKKPTKRLRYSEAYKLMNAKTPDGKAKPFDIRFATKEGIIIELEGVQKCTGYNREKGMRRMLLANGEFRNVYDVLIFQINDTKILVT